VLIDAPRGDGEAVAAHGRLSIQPQAPAEDAGEVVWERALGDGDVRCVVGLRGLWGSRGLGVIECEQLEVGMGVKQRGQIARGLQQGDGAGGLAAVAEFDRFEGGIARVGVLTPPGRICSSSCCGRGVVGGYLDEWDRYRSIRGTSFKGGWLHSDGLCKTQRELATAVVAGAWFA